MCNTNYYLTFYNNDLHVSVDIIKTVLSILYRSLRDNPRVICQTMMSE